MRSRILIHRVFNLIVLAHVMAYTSFFTTIIGLVGDRKVYVIDVVFAFLAAVIAVALTSRRPVEMWGRQNSTKILGLFVAWGLFELVLGLPRFGLSAFGESRLLVLPALFFLFFIASYRDRGDVRKFTTLAVILICLMPCVRAIGFFFLGGRAEFVDQFAGSSILSVQAGFRFIQAGEAALVSATAVGLLMFAAGESDRRRRYAMLLAATALLAVIAIVQIRSAWVISAAGLVLGSVAVRRLLKYAVVSVVVAAVALALLGPMETLLRKIAPASFTTQSGQIPARGRRARADSLKDSVKYSATFLSDPAADVTAAWRLALWDQALSSAAEHPLFGHGLGGYWQNVGPNGAPVNQMPHNGYLALLVKLGSIGLALLLVGAALWYRELVRFVRREPDPYFQRLGKTVAVAAAMLALFAFFYDFTVGFWVLLGIGTVLIRDRPVVAPV